jgi:uncharacterized protein YbjT (DUF2867 family)
MRILLLGATGSAGGSVLLACLASPRVESVRAVVRRPLALSHPKLRVFVHADYLDYAAVAEAFTGVDACFDCLGISVGQTSGEAEYRRITHDFALAAARALRAYTPAAAFHYLSGDGASLGSRFMWARVKAEAERDLIAGFAAVCWRPAAIDGEPSRSEPRRYKLLRPILRVLFGRSRRFYVKGEDIGRAMLLAADEGMRSRVVANREIRDLADRSRAV